VELPWIFRVLDPYLIWGYRLTGHAPLNFFLGTVLLVVISLLLAEISSFLASRAVRKFADRLRGEARRYHQLSLDALAAGDRDAYQGANHLANEAFGKTFFLQVAQSAAFFWPPVLVLAWMQYRFLGVEFPLPIVGWSLGFIGVFILVYLPAFLGWKRLKVRLFHGRRVRETPNSGQGTRPPAGQEDSIPLMF
jgi:hypothetical protein